MKLNTKLININVEKMKPKFSIKVMPERVSIDKSMLEINNEGLSHKYYCLIGQAIC